MAVEVSLPRLGQGMEAGTIVRWLKSEGDTVEKGEALYELDTDKVTQEVEAEASGTLLKILAQEGGDRSRQADRGHRRAGRAVEEEERRRWTGRAGGGLARARARGGARAGTRGFSR